MGSLIKRIASRLMGPASGPEEGRIRVAAFGKHPAWNDHMEDLGLDTEVLVAFKRMLYVQGIARNIQLWRELEKRQASIDFGHAFVWCRNEDIVVGRLWKSCDGSPNPRTEFPMIVCAHGFRMPLRWVCDQVLIRLADLELRCRNAGSAPEVRAGVSACQEELSRLVATSSLLPDDSPGEPDPIARLADDPELGPGAEGLVRILHHLDGEMRAGSWSPADPQLGPHAAHARVPLSARRLPEVLLLWTQLLLGTYGVARGMSAFMPSGQAWLDLLVGEPEARQLYCLRAALEALPLTTTVPFKISPAFAEEVGQRIVRSRAAW
ncbi:MAG: hypothetical protein MUC88_06705 [Planctomycetes bacterium]|jgi:hypothetical protein|nr:hypothetical protein [Planctomycetota bacterium]